MGSVIRAGVTLVASAVVAVVAWIVARWMAGAEELAAWPILPAILASLAVLQGLRNSRWWSTGCSVEGGAIRRWRWAGSSGRRFLRRA